MSSFDIGTLASFRPPAYVCEKCAGLLNVAPYDWNTRAAKCPICGVVYVGNSDRPSWKVGEYLESIGHDVRFRDLIEHSRKLAEIATQFRRSLRAKPTGRSYPPIRALLESLLAAERFVHFTTVGMAHAVLGVMKMTALRVPVRGIVTNADESLVEEFRNYREEAPRLDVKVYEKHETPMGWKAIPHQKIVIIDGLMAFKGSANLSLIAWRKAARGQDMVEVVTEVNAVTELNNLYFSPAWGATKEQTQIEMDAVPF